MEIVKFAVDVLKGLQHLHDVVGLLHRDISPRNVVFGKNGDAKLLDLGIGVYLIPGEYTSTCL